jgi:hypothetical protein
MCAARAGVPFDSSGLEPDSAKGFDLVTFPVPRGLRTTPTCVSLSTDGFNELRAWLARPAWLIVEVSGPVWVGATGPKVHPRFGALCGAGRWGEPFHSVVVADWDGHFHVLDPYVPSPVVVGADDLLDSVAGRVVVVDL